MRQKNGSQVIDVLGVEVELVGGTLISKRDAQRVLQAKLDVTDRQARASVSSYQSEGWCLPAAGINGALAHVSSFENRALDHADRRADASVENGRLGGRPRR